jgi:hypothetical protein
MVCKSRSYDARLVEACNRPKQPMRVAAGVALSIAYYRFVGDWLSVKRKASRAQPWCAKPSAKGERPLASIRGALQSASRREGRQAARAMAGASARRPVYASRRVRLSPELGVFSRARAHRKVAHLFVRECATGASEVRLRAVEGEKKTLPIRTVMNATGFHIPSPPKRRNVS